MHPLVRTGNSAVRYLTKLLNGSYKKSAIDLLRSISGKDFGQDDEKWKKWAGEADDKK